MIVGGNVVALLPVDVARDEVVLIRQFRLPAHLAVGKGDLVEIVAGHVEIGETREAAAARECEEEIGVRPNAVRELFTYLTTPGLTDEQVTMFVGRVDASAVHARTASGGEHIRTIRAPIDAALVALGRNTIHRGPAVMALLWLALNRSRLRDLLG
jgi:ADP-ribose pyrophosphatase